MNILSKQRTVRKWLRRRLTQHLLDKPSDNPFCWRARYMTYWKEMQAYRKDYQAGNAALRISRVGFNANRDGVLRALPKLEPLP